MITDCHIHISPLEMFKPSALELMRAKRPNFAQIEEYCRSPKAFLKFLDTAGVDRAVLINYVAPEVIGFTAGVNQFISEYVKENPKRLLSCGSLHPRHSTNILSEVEQLVRSGIRMIKIHPPHQLLYPNDCAAFRTGNYLPGREAVAFPSCSTRTSIFGRLQQIRRPDLSGRRCC